MIYAAQNANIYTTPHKDILAHLQNLIPYSFLSAAGVLAFDIPRTYYNFRQVSFGHSFSLSYMYCLFRAGKEFKFLPVAFHIPEGVTGEIYQCMDYIRSHTNEPISINDIARQIHRSSSYTMKHFKEELGMPISAYITKCRLEDAKRLLAYSDKSLAEISAYLCFSSQAYFQNVFKKQYGITPLQYRKQGYASKTSVKRIL